MLTIIIDENLYNSGFGYEGVNGVMGVFACLMFPEPRKHLVWDLCLGHRDREDLEEFAFSAHGQPEAGYPGRSKEEASGVGGRTSSSSRLFASDGRKQPAALPLVRDRGLSVLSVTGHALFLRSALKRLPAAHQSGEADCNSAAT